MREEGCVHVILKLKEKCRLSIEESITQNRMQNNEQSRLVYVEEDKNLQQTNKE